MVRALGATLVLMTLATTALAEDAQSSSSTATGAASDPVAASVSAPQTSCGGQVPVAVAAEEQAFSAELEAFSKRRVFTERLMAQREAEAFERAARREARATTLKRELTQREAALAEREFEQAVTLYLEKRKLTLALSAAAARAKAAPSPTPPSSSSP
jgi:hypothetical protein